MLYFLKQKGVSRPLGNVTRTPYEKAVSTGEVVKIFRGIGASKDVALDNNRLTEACLSHFARFLFFAQNDTGANRSPMLFGASALERNQGPVLCDDGIYRVYYYSSRDRRDKVGPNVEFVGVRNREEVNTNGCMQSTEIDSLGELTLLSPSKKRILADVLKYPEDHPYGMTNDQLAPHLESFRHVNGFNFSGVLDEASEAGFGANSLNQVSRRLTDIKAYVESDAVKSKVNIYDVYLSQRLIGQMLLTSGGVRFNYDEGWILPLATDLKGNKQTKAAAQLPDNGGSARWGSRPSENVATDDSWRRVDGVPPYISTVLEEDTSGVETPLAYKIGSYGRHLCNIDIMKEGVAPPPLVDVHSHSLVDFDLPGFVYYASNDSETVEGEKDGELLGDDSFSGLRSNQVSSNPDSKLKFVVPDWWDGATHSVRAALAGRQFARLSGMQLKVPCNLSVDSNGDPVVKPAEGVAFTHILKIAGSDRLAALPCLEYLGMSLAKAAGLKTPAFAMVELPQLGVGYIVERFDIPGCTVFNDDDGFVPGRTQGSGLMLVEDFASICGKADRVDSKYHGDYEECLPAIDASNTADVLGVKRELFKMLVFSELSKNHDLHLKNLALLKEANRTLDGWSRVEMSPIYDVVPISASMAAGSELPLCLNGSQKSRHGVTGFLAFALRCGISPTDALSCMNDIQTRMTDYLNATVTEYDDMMERDLSGSAGATKNVFNEVIAEIGDGLDLFASELATIFELTEQVTTDTEFWEIVGPLCGEALHGLEAKADAEAAESRSMQDMFDAQLDIDESKYADPVSQGDLKLSGLVAGGGYLSGRAVVKPNQEGSDSLFESLKSEIRP